MPEYPKIEYSTYKSIQSMKSPRGKPRGIIGFGYFLSSRSKLRGIRPSGDLNLAKKFIGICFTINRIETDVYQNRRSVLTIFLRGELRIFWYSQGTNR